MKRIPIASSVGVPDIMVSRRLIIPAAATRRLQLAGGQPMEQSVPEDYYLASMTMRALQLREGRTLEFLLKAYLPIVLVPTPTPRKFCLVEQVGLTSEVLRHLDKFDAHEVRAEISQAQSSEDVLRCIATARAGLGRILDSEDVTIVGLLNGLMAPGISAFLERPSREDPEDYSIILPGIISESDFEDAISVIKKSVAAFDSVEDEISGIVEDLAARVSQSVGKLELGASPTLGRLELRIEALEHQIDDLQSELRKIQAGASQDKARRETEVSELIEARKKALQRDLEKKSKIAEGIGGTSRSLISGMEDLKSEADQATKILRRFDRDLENLSISANIQNGETETSLLLPFIIAGFSRKGLLQIEVYPPSYLTPNSEQVSRRKDFIDNLSSSSHAIDALCSLLADRANTDVTLRKRIREQSARQNLLAVKTSRKLILDGAEFLLGDGLLKQQLVEELRDTLSSIPESKLRKRLRKTTLAATDGEDTCRARFHVHDESGKPVQGAELELGALILESDNRGIVEVFLPKSRYEGIAKARGFFEKPFEFVLESTDPVMIPITLRSLSHEDQMAARLDELMERARRLDVIRERLSRAFEEQGSTLLSIPAYRSALSELLTELGYEPESWIAMAKKQQGMVKRLLKRDDRRDALRRDILHIAEDSKQAGGIMLLSEVLVNLDNLGWESDIEEIESIINEMSREGLIQGIQKLEGGILLVEFVPVALTDDPQNILGLAASKDGVITIEDAVVGLGWKEERVKNALEMLVATGVAKEQKSYSKSTQYWFPGLRGKK